MFDGFLSFAIFLTSLGIVYFSFQLVPQTPVAALQKLSTSSVGETYIGPITGRTNLFNVDLIATGNLRLASFDARSVPFAVTQGSPIVVDGWALDSDKREAATRVIAVIENEFTIGPVTISRPDVVSAFHLTPENLISGFQLTIPTKNLVSGNHRLHFLVVGTEANSILDTNWSVKFRAIR